MSLSFGLFALLLIVAAGSDLARYRIPNLVVLALLGLFAVLVALNLGRIDWTNHLAAGGITFLVTVLLYAWGKMGAGDAKLLAVLGLWTGLLPLVDLLFWMSIAGLGLILVLIPLRQAAALQSVRALGWLPETLPRILRRKEGVPYGVAIAIGALAASPSFPAWLW